MLLIDEARSGLIDWLLDGGFIYTDGDGEYLARGYEGNPVVTPKEEKKTHKKDQKPKKSQFNPNAAQPPRLFLVSRLFYT